MADPAKSTLPSPLSRVLLDPVNETRIPEMWRHIEAKRLSPPSWGKIFGWASLGAAFAVVTMAVALLVLDRVRAPRMATAAAGPLMLVTGAPVPTVELRPGEAPRTLELADGSRIELAEDTRFLPLASSGTEFVVRLVSGRAAFEVTPGGPRKWVVEAGLARVEVVGTGFSVSRTPELVHVEVRHGVVLVRGNSVPDGVARLEAGNTLDVRAPVEAPRDTAAAPSAAIPDAVHPVLTAPWRDAARRGDYTDAYGTLGADGLTRETARATVADDLFTLADVARLSGHPAEAVPPLQKLLAEDSASARAPLAAVTLGRILLSLGRARDAAATLEQALALGVPAGLEEDVYVRLVEAHVRSGNRAAARLSAGLYARRFPNGRRAPDIERWLAR